MKLLLSTLLERVDDVTTAELKHLEKTLPEVGPDEKVLATLPIKLRRVFFVSHTIGEEHKYEVKSAHATFCEAYGEPPDSQHDFFARLSDRKVSKIRQKFEHKEIVERCFWTEVRSTLPPEKRLEGLIIKESWKIAAIDKTSRKESPIEKVLGETLPGLHG